MISWKLLRVFEISKIRRFEHSWNCGIVELFACGLFKLGVVLYLGGVICEKALFSVKGVKRELGMFFRLTPWGTEGGGAIRVR